MHAVRWLVVGVVVSLVALVATPAQAGVSEPDGEAKKKGGSFVGLGIVDDSSEGRTVTAKRRQGETAVFVFRF